MYSEQLRQDIARARVAITEGINVHTGLLPEESLAELNA